MIQYYTLEEAANLLHVSPDKLKDMVKRNEVRAFQDRGTHRFRKQEVDELVRSRGHGSDPDLPLGDKPKASGGPPSSKTRRKSKVVVDESTFNLSEDNQVPLADHPLSSSQKGNPGSGSKRNITAPRTPAPRSPFPKSASDSDVRLVSDGSDLDFHIEHEEPGAKPRSSQLGKSSTRKKSKLPPPVASDSRVPILPPDLSSDSDVRIEDDGGDSAVPIGQQGAKSPSDSDIRLEGDPLAGLSGGKKRDDSLITEEIDLDAEAANIEAARKKSKLGPTAHKPANPLPTSSPFELSENDLDMGMEPDESAPGVANEDSSADFELTAPDDGSPIEPGSDELQALGDGSSEDEVTLGELTGAGAGASGINIQEPGDSGISLEGSEDEIEFDLSLDANAGATPKPGNSKGGVDSSSEFELSLPDDENHSNKPPDSDSEFELTLDEEGSSELELEGADSESSSDSEFELTLDEEGGLTAVDESDSASEEEGKDIFETDFDVPALDEESGTDGAQLEGSTELEESEFELDMDGGGADAPTEEESGSEDFALDDEPAFDEEDDEPAPAPKKKTTAKGKKSALRQDDEDDLDISLDGEDDAEAEEDEEPAVAVGSGVAAPPAEWGALPAIMLFPCVIILVVVGLMGFELMQGMWGFHKPAKVSSLVIDPIARMFDDTLPKE